MIEALFLRLKHSFSYHKLLKNFLVLENHVETYFNSQNDIIPHYALKGATPFEAYTCTGLGSMDGQENILKMTSKPRAARRVANLTHKCVVCPL